MSASRRAAAIAAVFLLAACGDDDDEQAGDVVVLSRNVYLGAPIEPLFLLPSLDDVPVAVDEFWDTVVASDIPARARAIASEIAALQPDLVGLQEATLWRTQSPPDGPPALGGSAAETVEFDFVQLILDELAARGFAYDAVATSTNFDAELTAFDGVNPLTAIDVRMTDRDVILARSGVGVLEVGDGRYQARVQFPLAGAIPIEIPRGWTSAVASVGGTTFRFVSTHLEVGGAFEQVQVAQAQELAAILNASTQPTILVGDLNSNAIEGAPDATATYGTILGAGFADAWAALRPGEPGPTCCQAPDLRNAASTLQSRLDLVLFRGAWTPTTVDIVGEDPADRTPSGLWPSDHAGVAAALRPN